jgi:hypothetical protein
LAYTLAYLVSRVPNIPGHEQLATARPPDRHEHFGTEQAALRRAAELLPAADWLDMRLYGPDGRLLAAQETLAARLGLELPSRRQDQGEDA